MRREFSAGGVVFKKEGNKILWLLRQPAANPQFKGKLYWGFPKGWIKDHLGQKENLETTANREVVEEGGVQAKIIAKIGTVKLFFTNEKAEKVLKFVTYFLMEWQKDLPEGPDWETGAITWLPFEEAKKSLTYSNDKSVLQKASELLKSQEKLHGGFA